jgi:hypothetical protein
MVSSTFRVLCLAFATYLMPVTAASAAIIQLDALDSGNYNQTGLHVTQIQNYLTGRFGNERRSFFVFGLAGISGTITGATLNLYNPEIDQLKGYVSPDPTETLSIFDVTTPIDTLTLGGVGLVSAFDDLGSGTAFGQQLVSAADNGTTIQLTLNAAALASLNASIGGSIAFGGALESIVGAVDQYVFGFSTAAFVPTDVRRLDLNVQPAVVPEPETLILLGIGLAALAVGRWRQGRRRTAGAGSSILN